MYSHITSEEEVEFTANRVMEQNVFPIKIIVFLCVQGSKPRTFSKVSCKKK